ncbi:MAG: hypothetical protein AB1Z98_12285 [Nannocystaceae bacterium]
MRVYVETNFVLELALKQTERDACERLIELAREGSVVLVIPAFSIFEAYYALSAKKMGIRRVTDPMGTELRRQLVRTEDFIEIDRLSADLVGALTASLERAESRLEQLKATLFRVADILALGPAQLDQGALANTDLGFADATVYRTIESDPRLGTADSCFVTRNRKDFAEFKEPLAARRCKLLFRFQDAVDYVGARLSRTR